MRGHWNFTRTSVRHLVQIVLAAFVLLTAFVAAAPEASACPCQLTLTKVEAGPGAPADPGQYTIRVTGPNQFQQDVVLSGDGTPVVLGPLAPGWYAYEELDPPANAMVSFDPESPVYVPRDTNVDVTVVNYFPAGRFSIDKVESGSAAPGGSYTFDVDGPGDNDLVAVVAAGGTWVSPFVPFGMYTITERDAPTGATISPNPVVVHDVEVIAEVTASNPYPAGRIAIEKAETGGTAPGGTYTFDVDGPGENDVVAEVTVGATWTSGWLPLGTYTITERDAPAGATISPNPVVLDEDGEAVLVTATNPYPDETTTTTTTTVPPTSTTVTTVAPTSTVEVLGVQVTQTTTVVAETLPATGSDGWLALLGLGLVVTGALVLAVRYRTVRATA